MNESEALKDTISERALHNLIRTTTCLETLNSLLEIKHRRIVERKSEKLDFSVDTIYRQNHVNGDLNTQVLRKVLHVVQDTDLQLLQAIKYVVDNLHSSRNEDELYHVLNLFSVIIEYYKTGNKQVNLLESDVCQINNAVLSVLKGSSKSLNRFTLIYLLPNYLDVSTNKENKEVLLKNIFNLVKELRKLEILCTLYDKFVSSELREDTFNLIKLDDFWLLIMDCIISADSYLQKQAVYLLSRSVEVAYKNGNLSFLPIYLKPENQIVDVKVWKNYFILLDVSSEKQLHIIEPSLQMLSSIKYLHPLWRICMYKIFLKHPQNNVVYFVASFILQNELEWSNFAKIVKEFLGAINKNECSFNFKKIFKEIGCYSASLNDDQFELFVQESLNLSWTPVAIWCFYSSVFTASTNFRVSVSLLENIIKRVKLIPHTYIRDGCTYLVCIYYINNFSFGSLSDFIKASYLLLNAELNNESLFVDCFIMSNRNKILPYIQALGKDFLTCVNDETSKSQYIEIYVKIRKILRSELWPLPHFETYSHITDLCYLLLFDDFNRTDLESYVENRFDHLEEHEDIEALLLLNQKCCTPRVQQKAFNILSADVADKYTTTHTVIAFGIINTSSNCKTIVNIWKPKFLTITEKIDERITQLFVDAFYRTYLQGDRIPDEIVEESVIILENILDFQSKAAIVILENITVHLKHANKLIILKFIKRCFEEFLNLNKSGNFKETAKMFLPQIFQVELLENEKLCTEIFDFTQKLLDISNNCNTIAYILSKQIAKLCSQNSQMLVKFIPIITELILYGTVINKNDRVEYFVCQERGQRFMTTEINPNFERKSIALWALDAMLNLTQNISVENAADEFVSLLIDKYMKNFTKRYFPDSQIHLCKLRIIQALLLLYSYTKSHKLINIVSESFLLESHQPSVKHLMQWLLICLLRNDASSITFIANKLKMTDHSRPSTVTGFIPVLYHLALYQQELCWDPVVDILLPCTMGPQFKLRIFSQVALVKLYEKAIEKNYVSFLSDYKFLYNSLKQVIEATGSVLHDVVTINQEFLEYFSLDNCDCSAIYHLIPKKCGVTVTEWENLRSCEIVEKFNHIHFNNIVNFDDDKNDESSLRNKTPTGYSENIQKKITPWKDMLDDLQSTKHTNNFILVTSLIEKPANLGGLSRTCEVFGVKQLVMKTSKITADKEFKSLSMSSENWVDIMEVKADDLREFILEIKTKGYCVVGAEQTSESVKLDEFKFSKMTVLILGNEKEGISPHLIPLLDSCIEIPQFGMVRSLNVHVAGAIVIWEYCKQHRL